MVGHSVLHMVSSSSYIYMLFRALQEYFLEYVQFYTFLYNN